MAWGWIATVGKIAAWPVVAPAKLVKKGAEKTMQAAILGILRHALTFAGGLLWTGDDLAAFTGAAMTIIGLVWSVIEKKRRET